MVGCFDLVFFTIFLLILSSRFEITPITPQKCYFHIFEKIIDERYQNFRLPFPGPKEEVYDRAMTLHQINSTKATINLYGKVYDFKLYENSTHIYVNLCTEFNEHDIEIPNSEF